MLVTKLALTGVGTMAALLAAASPLAVAAQEVAAPAASTVTVDTDQIEDIVVTAQRRSENVQRVPLAVSVIGSERFEQLNGSSVSDLTNFVPSLTFTAGNEGRNNSIRVRGLGTDVFSVGVEPSTSTIIDGVVLQRGGAAFSDLADIERIEVLRGPQGTLFGKNSSAGAINIVTRDPVFDAVEGSATILATDDEEYRVNAVVSGPITDTVAFRIAAFAKDFSGNIDNLNPAKRGEELNGGKAQGARLKLTWKASDTFELRFSGDYSTYDLTTGALPLIIASSSPLAPPTGTNVGPNNTEVNLDVSPFVDQKNYGASVEARLTLGEFSLISTTAYRRFNNLADSDLDNSQAKIVLTNINEERSKTFTQELRLVSPTYDFYDFVAGLFYFDGEVDQPIDRRGVFLTAVSAINPVTGDITFRVPGDTYQPLSGNAGVETRNFGLFGQANIRPLENLTLTLGGRYINEVQEAFTVSNALSFYNGSDRPPAPVTFVGNFPDLKSKDDAFIGKASLAYQIDPAILAYASYSTGYKGVGFNLTPATSLAVYLANPAPPETSEQFELGLKTRLFDNRLQLNLAAFSTRVKDYQGQAFQPNLGLTTLTSIGEVGLDGVELELTARPLSGLTLTGGVTYLDARFISGNAACFGGQTPANSPRCFFVNGVSGPTLQRLEGLDFPNAPKWRVVLGGRYEFALSQSAAAYLGADYRWQDDVTFDISNNPLLGQEGYGIVDLSAGVTLQRGLEVGVFVKNLADEHYAANKINFNSGFIGPSFAQLIPRDFYRHAGVTLRYRF